MKFNNLYNFKNTVKHFLNIDELIFPADINSYEIKNLCWVEPFTFRVKKQNNEYRVLKMPNILNFKCAYDHFKDMPNFDSIHNMDIPHKRMSANIDTGDFVSGEYDDQLTRDFEKLCVYDYLIKLDIKDFYGRIYTHTYKLHLSSHDERYLSNMNHGGTNGLLLGNYISLYFAETYLNKISQDIKSALNAMDIECEFSYFSDDFYFFCNKGNSDKIIKIFDAVLEKHNFERNGTKKEIWDYELFNNYNLVARYWKKMMSECNIRFDKERNNNKLYFINQILHRMSHLSDDRLKKVFINNFFKTRYFKDLDLDKFILKEYDYHQLCFIFKFSPEALLYATDSFKEMRNFDKNKLHKFLSVRYSEALNEPFNDIQLYFYYAIKLFGLNDVLVNQKEKVSTSNNQILVSYYLMDGFFDDSQLNQLKTNKEEKYWFQNYHLILYTDLLGDLVTNIEEYLLPKYATKPLQVKSYSEFYKVNLTSNISFVKKIEDVSLEIDDYLDLKIEEAEKAFRDSLDDEDDVDCDDDIF